MELRGTFGNALRPGLRKWYEDGFQSFKPYMDLVFNVQDSDKSFEEDNESTGVGYLEETAEGSSVRYEDRLEGYATRYTHKKFTKGIAITREEFEDNLYMKKQSAFTALGRSAARTPDRDAFTMFVNGFNTAYTSYGDAKPLFSTSHTRKDGGTAQSNASATGITLTEPNLNTGILALQQVLDHKGQGILVAEDEITLIVPPALRKTAVEITKSDLQANVANNNLNFYKGFINVLVVPWISALFSGSDTAWFLMTPKMEHRLNFFWRRRPSFEQDNVFDTEVAKYKCSARYSYGWSGWHGVWGSKGDGAAYSS